MNTRRAIAGLLTLLLPASSVLACSDETVEDAAASDLAAASADVAFHAEVRPFEGVDLSSGMQPAVSPVQVSLAFKVDGALTVDARAISGGSSDAPSVAGKAGSGKQDLHGQVKAEATMKINVSAFKYEGPLPGIENLDLKFGGTSEFDPFLVDGSTVAKADIPETKLPPIPLPGGVPGTITLTIEKGSFARSEFHGTCASVTKGDSPKAHYTGAAKLDGEVIVHATVDLKGPLAKSFDIPSFTVKIPSRELPMDLGDVAVAGGGSAPQGTLMSTDGCGATAGANDGEGKGSEPSGPGTDPGSNPTPNPNPTPDGGAPDATSCDSWNNCADPTILGSIAGDVYATPLTIQGDTNEWLSFRVKELDNGASGKNLRVRTSLSAPPGWTYSVRMNKTTDVVSACSATEYAPTANMLDLEWGEGFGANGSDDSRTVIVQIHQGTGTCPMSSPWSFKVERY